MRLSYAEVDRVKVYINVVHVSPKFAYHQAYHAHDYDHNKCHMSLRLRFA